jgi:hypothetical protein
MQVKEATTVSIPVVQFNTSKRMKYTMVISLTKGPKTLTFPSDLSDAHNSIPSRVNNCKVGHE